MLIDTGPGPWQDTIKATFILPPVQQECASPEVTLDMPSNFRWCLASLLVEVFVRNTGNILAEDVVLAFVKPRELDVVAINLPLAQQNGDTLVFFLGAIPPLAVATAKLELKVNCSFFIFERTVCAEAFARTLRPCLFVPPPSSEIKLTAQCVADTALRFTIQNIGDAPTSTPHAYRLIRSKEVVQTGNFSLLSQESMNVDVPADSATYRMEATKFSDGTLTAVALENCGGLTPASVNAFWLDRGPPEYDFACRQVFGALDPNLKTAVPTGIGSEKLIAANTPFEYTIDFQNTGTDTAFRVLLFDVLPPGVDINMFRPVSASHEHVWEIRGRDTLEVLFFPIALPDSNANEPASHGFFTFAIDQLPDLPDGMVFENKASIIFDFTPPIVTNTVRHTIGQLIAQVEEALQKGTPLWSVLGNPTRDAAVFISSASLEGGKRFVLFDAAGRPVCEENSLRAIHSSSSAMRCRQDGMCLGSAMPEEGFFWTKNCCRMNGFRKIKGYFGWINAQLFAISSWIPCPACHASDAISWLPEIPDGTQIYDQDTLIFLVFKEQQVFSNYNIQPADTTTYVLSNHSCDSTYVPANERSMLLISQYDELCHKAKYLSKRSFTPSEQLIKRITNSIFKRGQCHPLTALSHPCEKNKTGLPQPQDVKLSTHAAVRFPIPNCHLKGDTAQKDWELF